MASRHSPATAQRAHVAQRGICPHHPVPTLRDATGRRSLPAAHAAGTLLALALAATASARADETQTLPPVVVSAATFAQPLTAALPAVDVITREQIEESGIRDLPALLEQAAGLQITGAGIPGAAANVFIRGLSGPNVLVMIDGVPINPQDATGTAYIGDLGTDQIERIEIIRGNVSAIYGSGAIGGAILITTRRATSVPTASVSFGAGSQGSAGIAADASDRIGRTSIQAGASRSVTEGIMSTDPAAYGLPLGTDGYRNDSAHAALAQDIAQGQTVGLRAFTSDSQYTYGNGSTPARVRQQLVQAYGDNQLSASWASHLTLSQQMTNSEIGGSYASGYTTVADMAEWRNVVDLGAGWTATGGLNLQQQSIATTGYGGIPDSSRHANAVFGGINGTWRGNELQLNLRRDAVEGYTPQTTGYLGWGHELGDGFKALASYSTAFNAPPLGYLYYQAPGPYGWLPNPALQPERAHSAEAGMQWSHGADWVRATLFRTSATDRWAYTTVDASGDMQFRNIAASRTDGVELAGSMVRAGWRVDGNLTEQKAIDTSSGSGTTLPMTPHTLANVHVTHGIGAITVGAGAHFTGARDDRSTWAADQTFGGYTTVDLTASGPLSGSWSWNARVDNLFDKHYQTYDATYGRPFGLYLGLTWHPLGAGV